MKRILGVVAAVLILATTAAYAAPGQGPQGSGGWGMKGAYGRLYDPSTVTTVAGNVVAVNQMTPMKGMGPGLHVELKTEEGNVDVHLGPAWYLDRQDTRIQKGDRIEVKGSRVTVGGKPALIAAEVRKGDELLKLRDESGTPVWSGWRRGQ